MKSLPLGQLTFDDFPAVGDGQNPGRGVVFNPLDTRKEQKRISARLHKSLNSMGVKAQRKGLTNEMGDEVIALPNEWWLIIRYQSGLEFLIGKDRSGGSFDVFYDDEQQLLDEIISIVEVKELGWYSIGSVSKTLSPSFLVESEVFDE